MKILVVSNIYPPFVLGGYELLAKDVVEALRARGHVVDVLTTTADAAPEPGVHRTLHLARKFGHDAGRDRVRHLWTGWRNARATRDYLRAEGRPDVALMMSQRRLGLEPWWALQRAGVPVVATVNDDWPVAYCASRRDGLSGLLRRFVDDLPSGRRLRGLRPERVVWLSDAVRREVRRAGAPLADGDVVPQGVDATLFRPRAFRPIGPRPRLLFVGRLHPSKAPDVAIEAVAQLVRRGVDATLGIHGAPFDDAYGAALQELAQRLGVADRVDFRGFCPRPQLPDVLRKSDALLFASRLEHEGQGLTYLEAMACGLPVVAWPAGGAREFLDAHPAVVRTAACSGAAFADAVQGLIAGGAAAQEALVTKGLAVVNDHASISTYATRLEAELEDARALAVGAQGSSPRRSDGSVVSA
ncbi:MAG TPA: glycosyltransferase family 4 protein [Polyangia bacterium]|nr:glycosyltransferase family 4 protein [Polyangia bacterium]